MQNHSLLLQRTPAFGKCLRSSRQVDESLLSFLQDRTRHARECAVLAAGLETQIEYPLKVKAVLFPVSGGAPRIIDVSYRLGHWPTTPNIPKHDLDLPPVLGDTRMALPVTIQRDGPKPTAPALGHTLTLVHTLEYADEGRARNMCIERIAPKGFPWRDNAVGFRNTPPAERIAQYDDVTEDDVRVFTKYFAEGGDGGNVCKCSVCLYCATTC